MENKKGWLRKIFRRPPYEEMPYVLQWLFALQRIEKQRIDWMPVLHGWEKLIRKGLIEATHDNPPWVQLSAYGRHFLSTQKKPDDQWDDWWAEKDQ